MVASVTPIAGFDPTYAGQAGQEPASYESKVVLGTRVTGDDGFDYIFAQSTATIAASTQVVLTTPAMTFAAGAGDWDTTVAVVSGDRTWLKARAITT